MEVIQKKNMKLHWRCRGQRSRYTQKPNPRIYGGFRVFNVMIYGVENQIDHILTTSFGRYFTGIGLQHSLTNEHMFSYTEVES